MLGIDCAGCTDSRLDVAYEWMARSVTARALPRSEIRKPRCVIMLEMWTHLRLRLEQQTALRLGAAKVMLALACCRSPAAPAHPARH